MRLYRQKGQGWAGCDHQQFRFIWQAGSLHLEEHQEPHLRCPEGCKNRHLSIDSGSDEAIELRKSV